MERDQSNPDKVLFIARSGVERRVRTVLYNIQRYSATLLMRRSRELHLLVGRGVSAAYYRRKSKHLSAGILTYRRDKPVRYFENGVVASHRRLLWTSSEECPFFAAVVL